MLRIGVLADTHGLLRPAVLDLLRGCGHLIHAGDVGGPGILEPLAALAPITTVRGNVDHGSWADGLPAAITLALAGVAIHVLHDLGDLRLEPRAAGVRVVISGHTHQPRFVDRDGVLYLNPGSCGPRRFRLPISLAELLIDDHGAVSARLLELPAADPGQAAHGV